MAAPLKGYLSIAQAVDAAREAMAGQREDVGRYDVPRPDEDEGDADPATRTREALECGELLAAAVRLLYQPSQPLTDAHLRTPIDRIRSGSSVRNFQAFAQARTISS